MNTEPSKKMGRLVLTRRQGEKICIGPQGDIVITLLKTPSLGSAKLLIEAPKDCPIWREELNFLSSKES